MNQKIKQAGLFAILAVFTISLTTSFVGDAEAVAREGIRHDNVVLPDQEPDVKLSLKQIGELTSIGEETRKSYKGFSEEQYDTTETFRAVYLIQNEGKDKVWNIEILVESDVDTEKTTLVGTLDLKRSTVTVTLKALDPESINAKIVGFKI